jgi:hypothetical protein
MQTSTVIALVAAPILGPLIWWTLTRPGAAIHRYLYRRLPEGRLRRVLLMDTKTDVPKTPFG